MILYYAMGGGLGHVTRSIAILSKLCQYRNDVRCMVSSDHASIARQYMPCPVDQLHIEETISRARYLELLNDYLKRYDIDRIILDSFPWGIVGEWKNLRADIPRSLIARYLNWDAYLERVKVVGEIFPESTLIIEPLERRYQAIISDNSEVEILNGPILLQLPDDADRKDIKPAACVVHSGNKAEQDVLMGIANDLLSGSNSSITHIDTCFPEQNIYPAELIFPSYSHVISGAGYNMVAVASQGPAEREHILHPFERRFDDQFERYRKYLAGRWLRPSENTEFSCVCDVSQWLERIL